MSDPWNDGQLFSGAVTSEDPKALWETPPEIFDPLNKEFEFGIDAAALKYSAKVPNYIGPDHHDDLMRNAFDVNWYLASGGKPVWINPPYSKENDLWLSEIRDQGKSVIVCALIYARTETEWWWEGVLGRDPRTG